MKARSLIEGSACGPDTLKVLGQAFDEAWAEIACNFSSEASQETARRRLAYAVLAVAREDGQSPDEVRDAALQVMANQLRSPAKGR